MTREQFIVGSHDRIPRRSVLKLFKGEIDDKVRNAMAPVTDPLQGAINDVNASLGVGDQGVISPRGDTHRSAESGIEQHQQQSHEAMQSANSVFGRSPVEIYIPTHAVFRETDQTDVQPNPNAPPADNKQSESGGAGGAAFVGAGLGAAAGYWFAKRIFGTPHRGTRRDFLSKAFTGGGGLTGAIIAQAVSRGSPSAASSETVSSGQNRVPPNNRPIPEITPVAVVGPNGDESGQEVDVGEPALLNIPEQQQAQILKEFDEFEKRVRIKLGNRDLNFVAVETDGLDNSIVNGPIPSFYTPEDRQFRALVLVLAGPKGEPSSSDRAFIGKVAAITHDGSLIALPDANKELNTGVHLSWGFDNKGNFVVYNIYRQIVARAVPGVLNRFNLVPVSQDQGSKGQASQQITAIPTEVPPTLAVVIPTRTPVPSPTSEPPSPTEIPLTVEQKLDIGLKEVGGKLGILNEQGEIQNGAIEYILDVTGQRVMAIVTQGNYAFSEPVLGYLREGARWVNEWDRASGRSTFGQLREQNVILVYNSSATQNVAGMNFLTASSNPDTFNYNLRIKGRGAIQVDANKADWTQPYLDHYDAGQGPLLAASLYVHELGRAKEYRTGNDASNAITDREEQAAFQAWAGQLSEQQRNALATRWQIS